MGTDLTEHEKQLADLMSEISERCYHGGWMAHTEYVLWDAVTSGTRAFGHGEVTQSEIEKLIELSSQSQTWIVFDEVREIIAVPLDRWRILFREQVSKDPGKLRW